MILDRSNPLVKELAARLNLRGETLALAESCTGGLLSFAIASLPGVSSFYRGGVVSYHREVKQDILAVPSTLIKSMGEVSLPVAIYMARGARHHLKSDWAVSMTGIAGPSGGSIEKPVGTVCFGLVGPGVERGEIRAFGPRSRIEIQSESALFALEFLLSEI